jgi:hypothetical protein
VGCGFGATETKRHPRRSRPGRRSCNPRTPSRGGSATTAVPLSLHPAGRAVIHALDLAGNIAAEIVNQDHRIGVRREVARTAIQPASSDALFLLRQLPGRLRGQGEIEDRSGRNISFNFISADLKDFLPRFLILRKLSDVVDGQHVRRRRPDFFQGFHFGMSRSFTRLSVSLLSFFTDGPTNPE